MEEIERALTEVGGLVGGDDGGVAINRNRTTLLSRMKKLDMDAKQFPEHPHVFFNWYRFPKY
jgi:hypothetical protein